MDCCGKGINEFRSRLRSGKTTARYETEAYLKKIKEKNSKLEAFVYVNEKFAIEKANAIDKLLAAGIDLGPLMGLPVAVKDLFAISDFPPARAGSNIDVSVCIGTEGDFIKRLKAAGCIILGSTRTIEFAAGAHNIARPTPWNPCDLTTKRSPGGSSNGSAVAVGANLCGFAVGTDTGGSVRVPAALCGIFGLKTSAGLWPLDGVFPLSPALDSVGLLTASADDAAMVYHALERTRMPPTRSLAGCRFGIVKPELLDLEDSVRRRYEIALAEIECQGADLIALNWPTVEERADIAEIFATLVATDLLNTLGPKLYSNARSLMDPITCGRLDPAMTGRAVDYARLFRRCRELAHIGSQRLYDLDLDALLVPTTPALPPSVAQLSEVKTGADFVSKVLSISREANVYNFCAASLPLPSRTGELPVGLQIACSHGSDTKLLQLARSLEKVLSRGYAHI